MTTREKDLQYIAENINVHVFANLLRNYGTDNLRRYLSTSYIFMLNHTIRLDEPIDLSLVDAFITLRDVVECLTIEPHNPADPEMYDDTLRKINASFASISGLDD